MCVFLFSRVHGINCWHLRGSRQDCAADGCFALPRQPVGVVTKDGIAHLKASPRSRLRSRCSLGGRPIVFRFARLSSAARRAGDMWIFAELPEQVNISHFSLSSLARGVARAKQTEALFEQVGRRILSQQPRRPFRVLTIESLSWPVSALCERVCCV